MPRRSLEQYYTGNNPAPVSVIHASSARKYQWVLYTRPKECESDIDSSCCILLLLPCDKNGNKQQLDEDRLELPIPSHPNFLFPIRWVRKPLEYPEVSPQFSIVALVPVCQGEKYGQKVLSLFILSLAKHYSSYAINSSRRLCDENHRRCYSAL